MNKKQEKNVLELYESWKKSTNQADDIFIPFSKSDSWSGYMVMEFLKFILMKKLPIKQKYLERCKYCDGTGDYEPESNWRCEWCKGTGIKQLEDLNVNG